jgi:hypothetical protein
LETQRWTETDRTGASDARRDDRAVPHPGPPEAGGVATILRLQRAAGNAATAMLVQRGKQKQRERKRSPFGALASKISKGHSWAKHVIRQREFRDVRHVDGFAALIQRVIDAGVMRRLAAGRIGYYETRTNTLVLVNPNDRDGGTCFRPTRGQAYFNSLR